MSANYSVMLTKSARPVVSVKCPAMFALKRCAQSVFIQMNPARIVR
ncbi:hypothetical protein [Paraburkholderia bannensis]|nr:hypothetical protein [Paraburkholderia bannensis]